MIGAAIVWAAGLLYIVPPAWMLARKGWPVRAGLTMLAASLLPVAAMLAAGEDLPPGAGLALLMLAPFVLVALLTIPGGALANALRAHRLRETPE
jgi:hypothetical protein